MKEYLASLTRKGNQKGSVDTAGYRCAAILDYQMALADLTPRRAQDLYDELVDEGDHAVDTHRGALTGAKAFGRFCVAQSWFGSNPFAKVEGVGRKSRGKAQLRIDDGRKYVTYCLGTWRETRDRSAIAAVLPLLLNLRASEVSQLLAADVDDRGTLLWIAESRSKSRAGRRRALVPKVLIAPLRELAAAPAHPDGHLFAKESGEPADRRWVSYHVSYHMEEAGVPVLTTHSLRGLHATLATVQGVTGQAVAASMGHESEAITKAAYIDSGVAADAQTQRVEDMLTEALPLGLGPEPDDEPEGDS